MEAFINSLPQDKRSTVRLILEPGLDEDRYCDSIATYLGDDYVPLYVRARRIEQARTCQDSPPGSTTFQQTPLSVAEQSPTQPDRPYAFRLDNFTNHGAFQQRQLLTSEQPSPMKNDKMVGTVTPPAAEHLPTEDSKRPDIRESIHGFESFIAGVKNIRDTQLSPLRLNNPINETSFQQSPTLQDQRSPVCIDSSTGVRTYRDKQISKMEEKAIPRKQQQPKPSFLLQLTGDKLKLAEYFITHKDLLLIRSLLLNEEESVQHSFEEWFRKQPDYKEKIPQFPIKKVTLKDVLGLIETEQRRILASVLIRSKLWNLLDTVLKDESEEVRSVLQKWKERNPSLTNDASPRSRNTTVDSGHDSSGSLTNDCTESDCVSDDYDSDEDPTTWTPTTMENFIDKFPECINILILGETGVGKSTFINGLANYLRFNNIFEAKNNVEILIKAHFSHSDQDYNQRRIECEPTIEMEYVQNENTADGQSSTQNPRSYLISWGSPGANKRIRIIDTPGVGDTRGVDEEKKNFAKILDYIANFKSGFHSIGSQKFRELHAICILMKPNESKLTLTFRFCINELLTHLHVSASKNILFCFTNARQTLYQPGETLPTLTAHLKKLQEERGIQIPLNKSTLYCFDNESFRCLCAWREGVNFTDNEMNNFNLSWQTTVRETFRLFKRITALPVHNVNETISVNNVRSMVMALTGPLAKISKNQILNLQLITAKIQEVEDCLKEGKDLNGKLVVDMVELVPQELDHPVTVCTSPSCVELKALSKHPNAPVEVVYKDPPCHSPCALHENMKERAESCLMERAEMIKDPAVYESLKNCSDKREAAEIFLADANKKKYQLEKEAEMVNMHCVEFTTYLKQNSLMTYNDAYKEYVDKQIKEAKMVVEEGGSADVMKKLEEHRDQYTAQIEVIEKQNSSERSAKSTEQVYAMIDNLKKLEKAGPILEEVEKLQLISIEKEQKEEAVAVRLEGGWFAKKIANTTKYVTDRVRAVTTKMRNLLEQNGKKKNKINTKNK